MGEDYLQVRMDFSENKKNPVYALGNNHYQQRLAYFNSTIAKDVQLALPKGKTIKPFDIHAERNFGYKNYLTVLFFMV